MERCRAGLPSHGRHRIAGGGGCGRKAAAQRSCARSPPSQVGCTHLTSAALPPRPACLLQKKAKKPAAKVRLLPCSRHGSAPLRCAFRFVWCIGNGTKRQACCLARNAAAWRAHIHTRPLPLSPPPQKAAAKPKAAKPKAKATPKVKKTATKGKAAAKPKAATKAKAAAKPKAAKKPAAKKAAAKK